MYSLKAPSKFNIVVMYSFSMDPPQPLPPHSEGTPIVVMTGIPKVKAEQLAQVWQISPKSR